MANESYTVLVIDNANSGICDRFTSESEARKAYPDTNAFRIETWSEQEIAERDAAFEGMT
jgi:hypothetical protein